MILNECALVSIIIPLYNRVRLIGETLDSVCKQTYPHWEVVIVDDGSTDGSYEFVSEIETIEPRIKLYRRCREPKGAPTCRNIGVEKAIGKYVIFLDSDDLLAPYCLEKRVAFMESNPSLHFAVFLMMDFKVKPGDTRTIWNVLDDKNDLVKFLSSNMPWQTTSPIWLRTAFDISGKWDEKALSWQDWEFHIRALAAGLSYKKISGLPDCFIRRDDSDRMSKEGFNYRKIASRSELFIRVYNILKKYDVDSNYIKLLTGFFYTYAEAAALNSVGVDAKKIFTNVRQLNLVSKWIYFISWQLIALRIFFHPKSFFLSRLIRRFTRLALPAYVIQKPSAIHTIPLSNEKYEELIKELRKFSSNSNCTSMLS